MRIDKLTEAYDIQVRYVHFPLHPETPAEGRKLQDLFGTGPEDIAEKNARMAALMAAEGLPYSTRSHTYNSRLAQELGTWAETQSGGARFHAAVYKAYFVDTLNVGDPEVLKAIALEAGLSGDEAQAVLDERRFQAAVDADWAKSSQYGVTGVPTFVAVAAKLGVVGAQPYEALEQLVREAGGTVRKSA